MVGELGANLKKGTRKTCVLIHIGVPAQNVLTILGLMMNKIRAGGRGTYVAFLWSLKLDYENSIHFRISSTIFWD